MKGKQDDICHVLVPWSGLIQKQTLKLGCELQVVHLGHDPRELLQENGEVRVRDRATKEYVTQQVIAVGSSGIWGQCRTPQIRPTEVEGAGYLFTSSANHWLRAALRGALTPRPPGLPHVCDQGKLLGGVL